MRKKHLLISMALMLSLLLTFNVSARPLSATAPTLGTAVSFVALGGSTVTNTGPSTINGDLGVWPALGVIGFPPGVVTAPYTIHAGDAVAQQAQSDVTTAYDVLAGAAVDVDLTGQDLGGLTLNPGVYSFSSSAQLTGMLTLDALGDPNAVFIFKIGSALTTASASSVAVINGGSGCNVFWQVGSSATLGTTTSFQGNILALTSITLNTGATIIPGRALARNGALTLDTNTINGSACIAQQVTSTPINSATATVAPPTDTPAPTNTSGPAPTNTSGPAPTNTPTEEEEEDTPASTATLLPVITALPRTGGAPIRSEGLPWGLVVVVAGFSTSLLVLGVRAYRTNYRRKH